MKNLTKILALLVAVVASPPRRPLLLRGFGFDWLSARFGTLAEVSLREGGCRERRGLCACVRRLLGDAGELIDGARLLGGRNGDFRGWNWGGLRRCGDRLRGDWLLRCLLGEQIAGLLVQLVDCSYKPAEDRIENAVIDILADVPLTVFENHWEYDLFACHPIFCRSMRKAKNDA